MNTLANTRVRGIKQAVVAHMKALAGVYRKATSVKLIDEVEGSEQVVRIPR